MLFNRYIKKLKIFIFFILSIKLGSIVCQAHMDLQEILPPHVGIGIVVKSINDEKLLFTHNADQFFQPSSTLKILTAAVALKKLGPNFSYSTQLLADADFNNCNRPDLYLKFSGDPSLTAKDLSKLFASLKSSGSSSIEGNIFYDDFGYTIPSINSAWMISDLNTCEMVPLTKAIIDNNYYHFEICPAKTLFEPSFLKPKLGIEPPYLSQIDNQVTTVPNENYVWRSYDFVDDKLHIAGKVGISLHPQRIELPITDLDFYIKQNIAKALKENAIPLKGEIIRAKTPHNTVVLAEHKSQPLINIISKNLKYSENIPTGALFLELASLEDPSLNSWREASKVLTDALKDAYSINLSEAIIDDGGIGLSRYNLMSPNQLLDVLIAIHKDPSISSLFMNALPQNGKPGFLEKRLTDQNLLGKIYAKTGSMTGLSGLAGYVKTNKGNWLAFVIFINSFSGPSKPYRDFQDEVCRILIEQY